MTPNQKLVYHLFFQTLILLILYVMVTLLGAVKFLSPDDSLAYTLPYNQVGSLGNVLLNLAVLTGLLAGGVYIAGQNRVANEKLLGYTGWLWTGLLVLAVLSILIGFSSGRNMLELPSLLTVILVAALALFAGNILAGSPRVPVIQIWNAGIILSVLSGIVALLPAADYVQDRGLRALALGLNVNIAYPVAAVALGFWLMHRFSNVTPGWINRSIYTIAGMITLAGAMLTVPTFDLLGAPDWVDTVGSVALIVVPILVLIFAAHSYRALSDRNATYTLSAHWYALSLLLFLVGIGLIGAVQAVPSLRQWTSGTRLSDLQSTLTMLAVAAMSLGVLNQAAAEIRGQNRRVTGLMPFWLVAFGVLGSGLALGLAGVVQTFLERQLSVGYLDTQTLLIPLYTGWVAGLVILALGIMLYALIFWMRRPKPVS